MQVIIIIKCMAIFQDFKLEVYLNLISKTFTGSENSSYNSSRNNITSSQNLVTDSQNWFCSGKNLVRTNGNYTS